MRINISKDYKATADCDLLGYIGETNARTIEVEQPEVERADCYRLRFEYPDGVVYDVPIEDGRMTVGGSLLRESGHVKCQWLATAADGDNYRLVAKSNVLRCVSRAVSRMISHRYRLMSRQLTLWTGF